MQGLKGNIGDRGSLLAWRWTPFFALLTLALVVSLLTALAVPSAPLELFKQADNTQSALLRRGTGAIATQTGFGEQPSEVSGSSASEAEVNRPTPRRGSLGKLSARNRSSASRASSPRTEARIAEPVIRNDPPPAEPPLANPSEQDDEQGEEEEEEEEEAPATEAPEAEGDEAAEGEAPSNDITPQRPALLNPNALRTLPSPRSR